MTKPPDVINEKIVATQTPHYDYYDSMKGEVKGYSEDLKRNTCRKDVEM